MSFAKGSRAINITPNLPWPNGTASGMTFESMIQETIDFIELFVGSYQNEPPSPIERHSKSTLHRLCTCYCRNLLMYLKAMELPLIQVSKQKEKMLSSISSWHGPRATSRNRRPLRALPLSGDTSSPCTHNNAWRRKVAERFEMYLHGIELANGYHELGDSKEQHARFHASNAKESPMENTSTHRRVLSGSPSGDARLLWSSCRLR